MSYFSTIEHDNFPGISGPGIAQSQIEPTMPRCDFSGSEFQKLMTEFPALTAILDSRIAAMELDHQDQHRDHSYHKPMITEEEDNIAANQLQLQLLQSGESYEILDELGCTSPIDSIPSISNEIEVMDDSMDDSDPWNATDQEIWEELESISPNDLFEDPFAANPPPLPQIQGNFLENHKMDYFGK